MSLEGPTESDARTIASIAVMLGWMNVPPRRVLEEEIRVLKALARQPPPSALPADVAQQLREYLWLSHGHQGVYGDDGEMQCDQCAPVWDYKRAPLADVVTAAIAARRAVNLASLMATPCPHCGLFGNHLSSCEYERFKAASAPEHRS